MDRHDSVADDRPALAAGLAAWREWLASPPGRYVLEWEQGCYDEAVADLFGYIAVQLELPELDTLRNNRMPSRLHAFTGHDVEIGQERLGRCVVVGEDGELPFRDASIDLVTLPHVLEFSADPHQLLREVDRVLRPEGRVVVTGFNPLSLWGIRNIVPRGVLRPFLPRESQMIALPRLRDWLKLLGFEFERGRYGCYRPACRSERWLQRTRFLEAVGDRWWPICGALYCVGAVKRVRAMRLVGPVWAKPPRTQAVTVASPQCSGATVPAARPIPPRERQSA